MKSHWMNEQEAAKYMGITAGALRSWRWSKDAANPPYTKFGRVVKFKKHDLDAWMETRRINFPSELFQAEVPTVEKVWMNERDAAKYLDVTLGSLRYARSGKSIKTLPVPYYKLGGRAVYEKHEIADWFKVKDIPSISKLTPKPTLKTATKPKPKTKAKEDVWLTEKEAAEYLTVTVPMLKNWRYRHKCQLKNRDHNKQIPLPPVCKGDDGRIRYEKHELSKWAKDYGVKAALESDKTWLTEKEAAAHLQVEASTLKGWRHGLRISLACPPFCKRLGRIMYDQSELDEWSIGKDLHKYVSFGQHKSVKVFPETPSTPFNQSKVASPVKSTGYKVAAAKISNLRTEMVLKTEPTETETEKKKAAAALVNRVESVEAPDKSDHTIIVINAAKCSVPSKAKVKYQCKTKRVTLNWDPETLEKVQKVAKLHKLSAEDYIHLLVQKAVA